MVMERFVELQITTDFFTADTAYRVLDSAAIPVLIEHIEISENGVRLPAYKVLVPSAALARARRYFQEPANGSVYKRVVGM